MKLLALTVALFSFAMPAFAETGIEVNNVHAFETSEGMKNGAVLLTIKNNRGEADKLISASTSASDKTEIHQMSQNKGIIMMRRVDGVTIDPGQSVTFSPDGYHLMLMGLKGPLVIGKNYPLTLEFKKAGTIRTGFTVQSRSTAAASSSSKDDMKDMPGMDHSGSAGVK
jgi:copper(I)-binding protein